MSVSYARLVAALLLVGACGRQIEDGVAADVDANRGDERETGAGGSDARADDAAHAEYDAGFGTSDGQADDTGSFSRCGDDLLSSGEECDDGNLVARDGCSEICRVELGYACPIVGARCRAAACGDGVLAADEECEDGGDRAGDGCNERCRLEAGYACYALGLPCRATVCGDEQVEGTEQCDDGANDVPFDGCYQCRKEPICSNQGCAPACGDGIKFPGEQCDDGNVRGGDGCAPDCVLEQGFGCTEQVEMPAAHVLDLPVIYRDLRPNGAPAVPDAGVAAGHIDFDNPTGEEKGIVAAELGSDRKPTYAKPGGASSTTRSAAMFAKWFHDDPAYNRTITGTVRLTRNEAGDYVFLDESFFPLDGRGFVAEGLEAPRVGEADEAGVWQHNFSFTSEVRTQFEYRGGETLTFLGDDDVWVFVNGRLAVDLGGVHSALSGSVALDPSGNDPRFAISAGNIYEIVVFQAERHVSASAYKLTLRDFARGKTTCKSRCGDGVLTPDEACDDAQNLGGYGQCAVGCVFGPRCGDGVVQTEHGEECDDQNRSEGDSCTSLCKSVIVL